MKNLFNPYRATFYEPEKRITPESILLIVSKVTEIPVASIMSRSRLRALASCKQIYCYLCRKYTKYSVQNIGNYIGYNHATVTYSDTEIRTRVNPKYKSDKTITKELTTTDIVEGCEKIIKNCYNVKK